MTESKKGFKGHAPTHEVEDIYKNLFTAPQQDTDSTGKKRGRKPSSEETKSKRVNLLMLPSLYAKIEKIATMERISINELVSQLLKDYADQNLDLLEKYDEVFGDDLE